MIVITFESNKYWCLFHFCLRWRISYGNANVNWLTNATENKRWVCSKSKTTNYVALRFGFDITHTNRYLSSISIMAFSSFFSSFSLSFLVHANERERINFTIYLPQKARTSAFQVLFLLLPMTFLLLNHFASLEKPPHPLADKVAVFVFKNQKMSSI